MSETPMNDPVELIRRISNGEKEAFREFYDRYSSLSYTFAMRILRSRADADDLLQEVFVQAWRLAGTYDPRRGKPEAWIITMTKSRAIDKLRSQRRKERGIPVFEEEARLKTDESLGQDRMGHEVKLTVRGALDRLSEVQRTALELAYFEGLTQSEIAVRLGVPIGTVKTRLRDGILKLREFIKSGAPAKA